MKTLIVKTGGQNQEPAPNIRPPTLPLEKLLDQIGRILTAKDSSTDWLTMPQLATKCRQYQRRLSFSGLTGSQFEEQIANYFNQYGYLWFEGLRMDWTSESMEKKNGYGFVNKSRVRFVRFNCEPLPATSESA